MNYKEIKDTLLSKGFTLEYIQTSGELEMLHFINPKIDSEVIVDFCYDIELPQNILDGEEYDYIESEFLNDYPILSVSFNKDLSISYLSDNVIDTCGAEDENAIHLYRDDVNKLFHKVVDMLTNPFAMLDFQKEYNERVEVFNNQIKRLLPILKKYDLISGQFAPYNGNDTTMFKNYSFFFKADGCKYDTLDFNFDIFDDKNNNIFISIGNEKQRFLMNVDLQEFDDRLKFIMSEFAELKVLREKRQYN